MTCAVSDKNQLPEYFISAGNREMILTIPEKVSASKMHSMMIYSGFNKTFLLIFNKYNTQIKRKLGKVKTKAASAILSLKNLKLYKTDSVKAMTRGVRMITNILWSISFSLIAALLFKLVLLSCLLNSIYD